MDKPYTAKAASDADGCNRGEDRPYRAGRSTAGFVRGAKVQRVSDVRPGDLLIGVHHVGTRQVVGHGAFTASFGTVNLYRVVGFKTERGIALDPLADKINRDIFYVVYVCPDGSVYPSDVREMCGELVTQAVWDFDLHGNEEWFKAVRVG